MYQISAILSYKRRIEFCRNITEVASIDNYIKKNYDYVFQILPYNLVIAYLLLVMIYTSLFYKVLPDFFLAG